jgi:uncharacterized membrane protein YkgB
LIPYISNGPLISWMYPVFGIRGASWFMGAMEWLFGLLLFFGFWNRPAGILGALGSCATFVATVKIIPFMPNGWDEVAGGFLAMTGNVLFLMKDVVLLAASFYLLKQDVVRAMLSAKQSGMTNRLIEYLAKLLTTLGLLSSDLDYNFLRISMVLTFAFFGYNQVASIRGAVDGSIYQSQPVHLLALSSFWLSRGHPVLGSLGVDDLRAFVCGILG